MVAGCGMKIVKLLMFAVNFSLWAAGCVILGLGAWIKAYESEYEDLLGSENVQAITIIMICTGSAIFAIGFCGCCGAWKERPIFLKIYFLLVIAAIITELVAGIMALVYRDDVYNDINNELSNQLKTQYGKAYAVTKSIDNLQKDLKCCGASNYTDYTDSEWSKIYLSVAVPLSCCKESPEEEPCNAGDPGRPEYLDSINVDGCVHEMSSWVNDNLTVLGGVCLGLLGVQFLAMMFSCCLIRAIEEEK